MANFYVRSGAGGAGTGADWANAFTTMAAAVAAASAGDVFFVSEDHSETTASALTFSFPGTVVSPNYVYVVDHLGSVPPVEADRMTGAVIANSGNNQITWNGHVKTRGLKLLAGTSTNNATLALATGSENMQYFEDCTFQLGGNNASPIIQLGATGTGSVETRCRNCTFLFSHTSQLIIVSGNIDLRDCIFAPTGTVPTLLFRPRPNVPMRFFVEGGDFSALGSGKTIWDIQTSQANCGAHMLLNCKLGASLTIQDTTPAHPTYARLEVVNCDVTNVGRNEKITWQAALTTESTIVRTGGAATSWKIETIANVTFDAPFASPPIRIWNTTTGSPVTVTVEGTWGGGAVPDNDEIWIEASYLGDASSPKSSVISQGMGSLLDTPTAQTSSAAVWGGGTTEFKMELTFTPEQEGWVYVTVKVAKPSDTFYVDPKISIA